jgi:hypothetical protein
VSDAAWGGTLTAGSSAFAVRNVSVLFRAGGGHVGKRRAARLCCKRRFSRRWLYPGANDDHAYRSRYRGLAICRHIVAGRIHRGAAWEFDRISEPIRRVDFGGNPVRCGVRVLDLLSARQHSGADHVEAAARRVECGGGAGCAKSGPGRAKPGASRAKPGASHAKPGAGHPKPRASRAKPGTEPAAIAAFAAAMRAAIDLLVGPVMRKLDCPPGEMERL